MDYQFSIGVQAFILLFPSFLVILIGTWFFWLSRHKDKEQRSIDDKELISRLSELEMQLEQISQSVIPISTAFQAILIKELTHPHAIEFDELLWKVGTLVPLSEDEQIRLALFLEERGRDFSDAVPSSERDAANILPAVIRRTLSEQAVLAVGKHIKVNRKLVSPGVVGEVDVTSNQRKIDRCHEQPK